MALNRSDKSRILRRYFPGMTRNSEMSTEPSTLLSRSVSGAGVIASRTMSREYFVGVSPASPAISSSQTYCSWVRDRFSCFLTITASILCWGLSYPKMLGSVVIFTVIPAFAGIQRPLAANAYLPATGFRVPAFAGMTETDAWRPIFLN